MEKFIIIFECKSYSGYETYTNFGTAVDRVFDSYKEAHHALVNEIIPEVKASIDEGYIETAEEEGIPLDKLREISVEVYQPEHPYDLAASIELYDCGMGDIVEENNYKVGFTVMPAGYEYVDEQQEWYFAEGENTITVVIKKAE